MSALPCCQISEKRFQLSLNKISELGFDVRCAVESYFLEGNQTFYREWEVVDDGKEVLVLSDEYYPSRKDDTLIVTLVGKPGSNGRAVLHAVRSVLEENGGAFVGRPNK